MQVLKKNRYLVIKFGVTLVAAMLITGIVFHSGSYDHLRRRNQVLKHYVIGCGIFDRSGDILWKFPNGQICHFFDDGSFISARKKSLSYYDQFNNLKWKKEIGVHHQINPSIDGEHVLVLSDSYHHYGGRTVRFDLLQVFDLKGDLVKSFDFFNEKAEIISRSDKNLHNFYVELNEQARRMDEVAIEFSHANSFYEIGRNDNSERGDGVFVEGNYIVNDSVANLIFVLDKNLKKIIWSIPVRGRPDAKPMSHDVQVMENGHLLVYANGDDENFSTIDEIEPYLYDKRTLFVDDPPSGFKSPYSGGVQVIGENLILVSDITGMKPMIHEIDTKNNRKIFSMISPFYKESDKVKSIQQVKVFDLSSFLKNNQGL